MLSRHKASKRVFKHFAKFSIALTASPSRPVEGEMLHGMSEELRKFIAASATNDRSFLGFDDEDFDEVVSEQTSRH